MASYKLTFGSIGFEKGANNTIYVTWSYPNNDKFKKYFKEYSLTWKYRVQDSKDSSKTVWLNGSTNTESKIGTITASYNYPTNALEVSVNVNAVSKKHKVKGKQKAYFTCEGFDKSINIPSNTEGQEPAEDPSGAPSVELKGTSLRIYYDTTDTHAYSCRFQIVKTTGSTSIVEPIITRTFSNGRAEYTYNNVGVGNTYRVRCQILNKLNQETKWSPYSSDVKTAPDSVTSFTVELMNSTLTSEEINSGSVTVKAHWEKANNATGYKIRYATVKEYLDVNSTSASGIEEVSVGDVTTAMIPGVGAGQNWYFQIAASDGNSDSAYFSATNHYPLTIGITPSEPTTWSSKTTARVSETVYLFWVHNARDSSRMDKAKIEIAIDDGIHDGTYHYFYWDNNQRNELDRDKIASIKLSDAITRAQFGSITDYVFGAKIKWRVSTSGITGVFGNPSIERVITLNANPEASISCIQDINNDNFDATYARITHYPFYFKMGSSPSSQKVLSYHLSIITKTAFANFDRYGERYDVPENSEIFSRYYDPGSDGGQVFTVKILPSDVNLDRSGSYEAKVTFALDSGLTCEKTVEFSTNLEDQELEPEGDIDIYSDAVISNITVWCSYFENPDDPDTRELYYEDVELAIYRINSDGTFTTIAEHINNDGADGSVDPYPTLGDVTYRIVATDLRTGAIGYTDIDEAVDDSSIILQWDGTSHHVHSYPEFEDPLFIPEWVGNYVKLPYNVAIQENNELDVALVDYIGRSNPVSYYGTQTGYKANWSCEIEVDDYDTISKLRKLAVYKGDVYVREPSGTGYWAHVSVSLNITRKALTIPVSLSVVRVDADEVVENILEEEE